MRLFSFAFVSLLFSLSPAKVDATDVVDVVESRPWNLPYQCDEMKIVYKKGETRRLRVRKPFTKADKKRVRSLARFVAREMGADPRSLLVKMDRGASSNPHAIHILNEDIEADRQSYLNYRWSQNRENMYKQTLETESTKNKKYWTAKIGLERIQIYKNNPYYNDRFEFDVVVRDGSIVKDMHPYFALKYGPLDMQAVGYTKYWDTQAPPWIMCNHDGIIAFITGIWASREHQKDCLSTIGDGSYGVLDRRYARGRCTQPSRAYINRAKKYGLDYTKKAKLGKKWPQATTDRKEILEYMIRKARAKGLLAHDSNTAREYYGPLDATTESP